MKTNIIIIILIISSVQLFSFEPNGGEYFVENKGQWDKEVRYLSSSPGANTWITNKGIVYDVFNYEQCTDSNKIIKKGHVVKMQFAGCNTAAFSGFEKLETYYNYFIGNDKSKWQSYVPLYKNTLARNVYDGIDIRYYYDGNSIRYDLLIQPGANPEQIKMQFAGQENLRINSSGEMEIETSIGKIKNGKILAYQMQDGKKIEIPCRFAIESNSAGFILGEYDRNKELVIDPLIYSTYICATQYVYISGIKIDNIGNNIITGTTTSIYYPTTKGAYKDTLEHNGSSIPMPDIFVTKFDSSYHHILSSTFLGCKYNMIEKITNFKLDDKDNIIILGMTKSSKFPVTENALKKNDDCDTTFLDYYDIFITKLNPECSQLIFSTYFGGKYSDGSSSIALDKKGNIIIGGYSDSLDGFEISDSAICREQRYKDIFISKIRSDGSHIMFTTLLGALESYCHNVITDKNDNIIITGFSRFNDYPITDNAFIKEIKDSVNHITLTKINPDGTQILFSTFLGAYSTYCDYNDLYLDAEDNIFIAGYATGDYPVTEGNYKNIISDEFSCLFVTKIDNLKNEIIFSNLIGGWSLGRTPYSTYVRTDSKKNVYLTGMGYLEGFPFTDNAFQPYANLELGIEDGVIMMFSPDGKNLLYCSGIGGSYHDETHGLEIDKNDDIHVCGITYSYDYPVTEDAICPVLSGYGAGFICKFDTSGATSVFGNITEPKNSLYIYPNPVRPGEAFNIHYQLETPVSIEFRLYDNIGNFIEASPMMFTEAGMHIQNYQPCKELAPGVYWIRMSAGDVFLSRAFVVE